MRDKVLHEFCHVHVYLALYPDGDGVGLVPDYESHDGQGHDGVDHREGEDSEVQLDGQD